ncbi:MAG: tryptophan 7-halogenase [Tepidisphaeraceae bacterium]
MIRSVIVMGGGSAGLMTALALKRKIPQLSIHVVRSPEIGVIGVGESTTPQFPQFLFDYLGISRKRFYAMANPTWKTGIHFLWGPRKSFEYTFDFQTDAHWGDLSRANGYYCDEEFDSVNLNGALMSQHKAFASQPNGGGPDIGGFAAFHLFNPALVSTLEAIAMERGIAFTDAKITGVTQNENGVEAIVLEDGRHLKADFFVDASGFRSELLGRTLNVPFISYADSLYCDRAIVGSWDRGPEDFVEPYTVAETMDCGWCWQIDHEHAVNRGYVYSSRFLSDDDARAEFLKKNPKAKTWDHSIKFRSGRYERSWVKNVFAVGNACGFVEPLEATALMVASSQIITMVTMLQHSLCEPQPKMLELYNRLFGELWDHIRDFLSIHYRFNTRIKNEFWTTCCNEVNVSPIQELLDFYAENGPTGLARHYLNTTLGGKTQFGIEGFLTLLVGQKVPYQLRQPIPDAEMAIFRRHCQDFRNQAASGMTVAEALKFVKHPQWSWYADTQAGT